MNLIKFIIYLNYFLCLYYKMIGGRKTRSNKGKRRGSYKTGKTRSGAKFRGRKTMVKRSNNKSKRTRKQRSNKGKRRGSYGPRSRTRSGKKFRGGNINNQLKQLLNKLKL